MMNCTECRNALLDYVDGHVNHGERRRLDAHLADCAACRRQLSQERRLSGLLHRTVADAPSEHLLAWPARPPAPVARVARRRRLLVAAGVVAMAVVAVCWRPPPPTQETIASRSPMAPTTVDVRQFADLEAEIEREATAARLEMSAQLLAEEPAAERYAAEAMRFVSDVFPETKAGREAARDAALTQPAEEAL